jgi:hypothetical protein
VAVAVAVASKVVVLMLWGKVVRRSVLFWIVGDVQNLEV